MPLMQGSFMIVFLLIKKKKKWSVIFLMQANSSMAKESFWLLNPLGAYSFYGSMAYRIGQTHYFCVCPFSCNIIKEELWADSSILFPATMFRGQRWPQLQNRRYLTFPFGFVGMVFVFLSMKFVITVQGCILLNFLSVSFGIGKPNSGSSSEPTHIGYFGNCRIYIRSQYKKV